MAEIEYGVQMNDCPNMRPAVLGGYDSHAEASFAALGSDVIVVREIGADGRAGEWQEAPRG